MNRTSSHGWLLVLGLMACNPGNLSTTAGDYGVAFDDEPDCIEIDASYLSIEAPFTLDLFVRTATDPDFALLPLVVWPGAFALFQDEYQYLIFGPSNDTSASSGASSPTNIFDGGYHHVAATYTANGLASVYVDGDQLVFGNLDLLEAPGDTIYLGCWPGQRDAWFSGSIGEVRLQSNQFYDGDFAPTWLDHEPNETTLALWHLNAGRGTAILDEMGMADGELTGGEWVDFPMPGHDPDDDAQDTGAETTD
jgi:hypothetical protein